MIRPRTSRALALVLLAAATGLALPAAPGAAVAVLQVTTTADTDDGVCAAHCSLREAIGAAELAPGPDVVVFDPTLAGRTITLALGQLEVGSALRIDAVGRAITVSGRNASRVFLIEPAGDVALLGLAIRTGRVQTDATDEGGAIYNSGTLTLVGCTVRDSTSDLGGGISSEGSLTVVNSRVEGNTARSFGGGIDNNGELTVVASSIVGNEGGGISNGAEATVVNSLVTRNTATFGGGISNGGTLVVVGSSISGNYARLEGGGIYSFFFSESLFIATVSLSKSTVSGNTARGKGGGIFTDLDVFTEVDNSTITGNESRNAGGGIVHFASYAFRLRNSIVAANTVDGRLDDPAADCLGDPDDEGFNIFPVGTGCPNGTIDPGQVPTTVLLPLGSYGGLTPTHALRFTPDNPAADAGGVCPARDQRGFVAPTDGPDPDLEAVCDAGSVEMAAPAQAQVLLAADQEPVTVPVAADSLTYAVRITNTTEQSMTFEAGSRVVRPDGTVASTYGPVRLTLDAGQALQRTVTQGLIGPAGLYRLEFFVLDGSLSSTTAVGADALAVGKV